VPPQQRRTAGEVGGVRRSLHHAADWQATHGVRVRTAMQGKFRSAVVELAEPEQSNTAWHKLCGLLGVKDGDVLEAGKAEDKRLLRLRADLNETNMKTVEEVLDAALADKDAPLADKDAALAEEGCGASGEGR
jgi:hypothetical protein